MSEIIDFNELKNKVKESDVDKFEDYMYSLYSDVASGNLSNNTKRNCHNYNQCY